MRAHPSFLTIDVYKARIFESFLQSYFYAAYPQQTLPGTYSLMQFYFSVPLYHLGVLLHMIVELAYSILEFVAGL